MDGSHSLLIRSQQFGTQMPQGGPSTPSFDHLVGEGEHFGRNFEAERLSGFEVDHQLELGRLLDWQLCWFCSLENPVHIESATPPQLGDAGAIRHESAE